MLDLRHRSVFLSLLAVSCLGLPACSNLGGTSAKVASAVRPYRMDVIQGNVVTREQLAVLTPGMPRLQVRDVLGSSLLASVFHADRWDYVFTLKRLGSEPQTRKVTVFFKDDVLERIEADELPSESEFVSTLKTDARSGPLPSLQASEEGLKKFPVAPKASPAPAPAAVAPDSYPPLEPAGK